MKKAVIVFLLLALPVPVFATGLLQTLPKKEYVVSRWKKTISFTQKVQNIGKKPIDVTVKAYNYRLENDIIKLGAEADFITVKQAKFTLYPEQERQIQYTAKLEKEQARAVCLEVVALPTNDNGEGDFSVKFGLRYLSCTCIRQRKVSPEPTLKIIEARVGDFETVYVSVDNPTPWPYVLNGVIRAGQVEDLIPSRILLPGFNNIAVKSLIRGEAEVILDITSAKKRYGKRVIIQ